MLTRVKYQAPPWAHRLHAPPPHGRVLLSHAATPIHRWACPALAELGVQWSIKRDDLSGLELSGNKARKLEFLMADALAGGYDCVLTVGGMQSNHCRATAAAARLVGLEPHLVLLAGDAVADDDPGLEGNLLIDRLLGAKLHVCAASDYRRAGADLGAMKTIANAAAEELRAQGRRPYVVPVGGSNVVGTWGHIEAVNELRAQLGLDAAGSEGSAAASRKDGGGGFDGAASAPCPFDYIVMATGSAGSAAGVAIGAQLSGLGAAVHAVCVNGEVDEKYDEIGAIGEQLGWCAPGVGAGAARAAITIHPGAGRGYGVCTPEELAFVAAMGPAGGVLLDPVYTGKGLFHFCAMARQRPEQFRNARILFWHTGGQFGLWSKKTELQRQLPADQVRRFRLPRHEEGSTGAS